MWLVSSQVGRSTVARGVWPFICNHKPPVKKRRDGDNVAPRNFCLWLRHHLRSSSFRHLSKAAWGEYIIIEYGSTGSLHVLTPWNYIETARLVLTTPYPNTHQSKAGLPGTKMPTPLDNAMKSKVRPEMRLKLCFIVFYNY